MELRLTGTRDRLIGCIEKESILGKDISTCLPVSLNLLSMACYSITSDSTLYSRPCNEKISSKDKNMP